MCNNLQCLLSGLFFITLSISWPKNKIWTFFISLFNVADGTRIRIMRFSASYRMTNIRNIYNTILVSGERNRKTHCIYQQSEVVHASHDRAVDASTNNSLSAPLKKLDLASTECNPIVSSVMYPFEAISAALCFERT